MMNTGQYFQNCLIHSHAVCRDANRRKRHIVPLSTVSRRSEGSQDGDIPLSTVSRRSEGSQDGDKTAVARSARLPAATAAAAKGSVLVDACRRLHFDHKIAFTKPSVLVT